MAIKFSQFTVRTSSSDLSHIVGYNGADNIQITPTNFLNSALTGTAGQVLFYDTTGVAGDNDLYWDNTNKRLGIGTSTPGNILEVKTTLGAANVVGIFNGTMRLQLGLNNSEGAFMFVQQAYALRLGTGNTERMRVTAGGDVGIGTTSPGEKLEVNGNIKVGDSQQFVAGSGNDLRIIHDGTDSFINSNGSGDLYIQQFNDDKDIIFKSDNGAGSITPYITLDGSNVRTRIDREMRFMDTIPAKFGTSGDREL